MRKTLFALLIVVLVVPFASVNAQDTADESDGIALTVYNQGRAIVQDRRTFDLTAGVSQIDFTDVASNIDATSVIFTSLTDPEGTIVLEQNYVYDLVSSSALLERYVDATIELTATDGTTFTGQLLSGRSDIILRTDAGEVLVISPDDVRDIRFPDLPDGLITRPTLRWLLASEQGGQQQVELRYITGGINWTADYNLLLNTENTAVDVNGWVTLDNRSGTSYADAQLKLIAGDVNVAPDVMPQAARGMAFDEAMAMDAEVAQREFFEYQLYEIPRPVTVADNETKQIEFVTGTGVPASTFYVYDGSPRFFGYGGINVDRGYGQTGVTDVQNYLEFTTDDENGLGADLPAGRIRVYQEDIDGAALLIGEDRIDHTPQGEDVQLYLGNAFDLVGERTQTGFQLITGNVLQETWEIRLRNRKDNETVEIRVPERLTRWSNWQVLSSSHDYEQLNAFAIEFRVDVPPGEETVLTYTVQYSWPD